MMNLLLSQSNAIAYQNVTSQISPWLMSVLYPLGEYIVLPSYFGSIEIAGQDKIPTNGAAILAPTHRSRWDPLVVSLAAGRAASGRDLRFMVTATEVTGIQGWFVRRLGGFPVDVLRPRISSLRHGIDLLCDRQMMVIFGEGGIFHDNQVHPIKPGLGRLALYAQDSDTTLNTKIYPISIRYGCLPVRWRCGIRVEIGDPIDVSSYYQANTVKSAAKKVNKDLQTALQNLDEKNQGPK
jgi:1-acyl-sn-glycerol-3-phosphate acyltransferase